jgi:hypothetical protein
MDGRFGDLRLAFGLEALEFSDGFGALAVDASFLNVQVAELFFVREVRLQENSAAALGFRAVLENWLELLVAMRVESEFEFLDAAQTPVAIDDDLDEFAFELADGFQLLLEIG